MAIDQNARFGLGAPTTSWISDPFTTTDLRSGIAQPGWTCTNQVISRLNANAAQYGGRIRQARRRANSLTLASRQFARAAPSPNENPDSTMKTATANRP
jgi:hypothetical protein